MRTESILLALFVVAFHSNYASAEVYKCNDRYSSAPCENGSLLPGTIKNPGRNQKTSEASKESTFQGAADVTRCPSGQTLISIRPPPRGKWGKVERQFGEVRTDVVLKGRLSGYGKVAAEVFGVAYEPYRKEGLASKTIKFPDEGGEQSFELRFTVNKGWQWVLDLQNQGRFKGYCSPLAALSEAKSCSFREELSLARKSRCEAFSQFKSSWIRELQYCPQYLSGALILRTDTGEYLYKEVPAPVWDAFKSAPSKGTFYHQEIAKTANFQMKCER